MGNITVVDGFDKKEFLIDLDQFIQMRYLAGFLLTFLLWTPALAEIEIRCNGSFWATLEDDGDVRIGGSYVGQVEDDGDVRKNGSYVGIVESDGDIRKNGSYYAVIEEDGDLRINGSYRAIIEPDGDIRLNGSFWGSARGIRGYEDIRRVAAVLVFFSNDF